MQRADSSRSRVGTCPFLRKEKTKLTLHTYFHPHSVLDDSREIWATLRSTPYSVSVALSRSGCSHPLSATAFRRRGVHVVRLARGDHRVHCCATDRATLDLIVGMWNSSMISWWAVAMMG
jgi:hypothetical protein